MQPDKASAQALWSTFEQTPDFFLRVRGDSMDRTGIRDGDVVAVRRDPAPRDGDVVVARIGNEITMKRYRPARNGAELWPESTNEAHATIRLDNEPDCEIVGIVVGAIIATPPDEEATGDGSPREHQPTHTQRRETAALDQEQIFCGIRQQD